MLIFAVYAIAWAMALVIVFAVLLIVLPLRYFVILPLVFLFRYLTVKRLKKAECDGDGSGDEPHDLFVV